MNNKKSIVYKALLIVGIVLIVVSAFVPLTSINYEQLYETLAETSDTFIDEEEKKEITEELQPYESFTLSDMYFAKGELMEDIKSNSSADEWSMVEGVTKGLGIVLFGIPLIIMAIATIGYFIGKNKTYILGIVTANAIYTIVFNIVMYLSVNVICKEICELFSYYYRDEIEECFGASVFPLIASVGGALICFIMAALLTKDNKDIKVSIKKKDAVISFIEGDLKGADIPLAAGQTQVVGREAGSAQIVLGNDPKVSRTHCKIEYSKKDNVVYITDMSSNGTVLGNGVKLAKDVKTPIESGTTVILSPASKFIIKY